jgi:hypothetical protein
MTRKSVTVTVADVEQHDDGFPFQYGTPLAEAIAKLNEIAEKIPEQYRATAVMEVDSVSGYEGSHYAHIEVAYTRPETDQEMADREQRERFMQDRQRDKELAVLEALKAKYPAA